MEDSGGWREWERKKECKNAREEAVMKTPVFTKMKDCHLVVT